MKGMQKAQPQRLIINTPIRTRDGSQPGASTNGRGQLTPNRLNKENQPTLQLGGLSPSKINPTRKPALINKGTMQYNTAPAHAPEVPQLRKTYSTKTNNPMLSSRRKECLNHPDKYAEFRIEIDGEYQFYCYKCSTHLVSQGFNLEKLSTLRQNSSRPSLPASSVVEMEQSKPTKLDPAVLRHPRFQYVQQFSSEIDEVAANMQRNYQAYEQLPNHYSEQFVLVEQFYDAMISYIHHVKSHHLEIMQKECRKYTQIGEIQASEISEALTYLNEISNDIKNNINEIVLDVVEDKYRECINFYDQKVKLYKHRVEDDAMTLQQVTELSKESLEGKLNEYKAAIDDLLGVAEKGSSNAGNPAMTSNHGAFGSIINGGKPNVNSHSTSNKQMFGNMQKKPAQQVPQRASLLSNLSNLPIQSPHYAASSNTPATVTNPPFRNLFEEEESMGDEQQLPDQSPQFKNM